MTEIKDAALGIDLGTTCCVVSVFINGKVVLIPNRSQNSIVTPSYVCYRENGTETFGVVAKDQAYKYPECTIFNAKRIIGRTWGDPVLQAEMKQWPFDVKSFNGFPKVKIGKKSRNPQEISARLLEIFCREAEKHLQLNKGSVTKAVITVPANFNALQRRATIEAGELAGMEVLDILNEPTAAAIAYKFEGRGEQKIKTLLIYDLGGGTFDVAIVKVTDNSVLCLNIDGDTHLGGEDFDNAMVTHCAAKFEKEVGVNLLEQKDMFKSAVARLRLECEKAKMALSSCEVYPMEVQCIHEEKDLSVEVTRAELEGLIKPHVEKTIEIVNRAIRNAKDIRSSNDIDEIILIGGSTRIPLVHTMLANAFPGKPLNFAIDPELTVSRGAAVHAAILSGTCEGVKIQDFQIKEQPSVKKANDSAHGTESLEAAEDLVKYRIGLRVQSLPAPKFLKIAKSNAPQPVELSKVPQFDCEFSSLLSMEENRVLLNALGKGQKTKIVVVGSILAPSEDKESWAMKIFNHPICLIKDGVSKFYFIQAFHLNQKKFVYRKKVENDFSYITPKPGFLAFEDDDGLLVGVLFHDFTEAHLFSETLKILLEELKKDSEAKRQEKAERERRDELKSKLKEAEEVRKKAEEERRKQNQIEEARKQVEELRRKRKKAEAARKKAEAKKIASKKMCFEESAVFKEINNDMRNLAISSGYGVTDIQGIWIYPFSSVRRTVEAGECTCGTISQVNWDLVRKEWRWNAPLSFSEPFKQKYESILKRAVDEFNEHRDGSTQGCFCRRVLKKKQSAEHFDNVRYKALIDLQILARTAGYGWKILGEIAETRRDFFKENLEKNVCVCSTFHCPDWKLVGEKSGHSLTETFKQQYESNFKVLTEEFNKHHEEGNQDCFCRTVTRPLLVELRLSKSEKGVQILKEITETKASAGEAFKMLNIFSNRYRCRDFRETLTKEKCVCKTLFNWIWEKACNASPQMKRETSFKSKFEPTFQRAVQEFNELRDEANAGEYQEKPKKASNPPPSKPPATPVRPERSLLCLGPNNPLRLLCYAIIEWKGFEYIILVTILATCVCLAAATPYPNNDSDGLNASLEEVEIVFTVIFTSECVMKIIAMGLIAHEGAYLRGGMWNILDFTIVVMGLLEPILSSVMEGFDVKALRAFRVLRPLRLVSGVPALQIVMNAILMAMIPLAQIALLVLFVMAIYAIIGLEMFEGKLHKTCFNNITGEMMPDPANCGGGYNCDDQEEFTECRLYWEGPNDGITNFDNIFLSMLTVFQCTSLEGWTDMMYSLQDGMGVGWEWIYFTSMVVLGAFFVMNLILGVLSGEFGKQKEKSESRGGYLKMKEQRQIEESLGGYLEWITTAECTDSDTMTTNKEDEENEEGGGIMRTPAFLLPYIDYFTRANHRLRLASHRMIKSQTFYWTIIVLVFLNTVVLATEHYGQPVWLDEFQSFTNIFFVCLFTLEMLLKMYTLGLQRYFVSLFNRFDFFATLSSILEVVMVKNFNMNPIGVSVLRCVRLLRVFKVTKYWKAMSSLVQSLLSSVQSIAALLLLLYLFMMIFALLGMQVFGGKFNDIDRYDFKPRANFDSFAQAMLTVFQILTGEDWNEVMWLGILSMGGVGSTGAILAVVYFVILFTFGNYILLNVFLAIAVDNLGTDEEEEEPEVEKEEETCEENQNETETEVTKGEENATFDGTTECDGDAPTITSQNTEADQDVESDGGGKPEELPPEPKKDPPIDPIPEGSSFFILSSTNPIRVFCHSFMSNAIVGNFLLMCILVSSGLMAAEDPVYEDSPRNKLLDKTDLFFTAVFTVELTLKLIIYGLLFHPGAFCRSGANILDFIVVGVSLLSIFSTSGAVSTIKILRVFRVLRPLRAINRAPGLKRVIQCMIVAIKTIGNILIVTNLIQFMYAVIGVQLFKGALFQCTDPAMKSEDECQGQFITYEGEDRVPVVEDREWENSPFNFDSVPNGMLTLFAVSTFEGWPQMLYKCIDSAGEGEAPVYNNRMGVAAFYISYLIIISFFMINIFVGFVILTFQTEGEREYAGLCDLEKNQRNCLHFAMHAKPIKKYIPTTRIQYQVWALVSSQPFDYLSFGLIILNTVSLGMKFYDQPDYYTEFLDQANIFFTVAFTIEFVLKLIAFGPKVYCSDAWNIFDALIVAGSYVDIIFSEVNIGVLKLFRVGRLIKLLNKSEGIKTILYTFIKSLQALPYVILLIMLLFFIYAIVGMQSFAKIALDEDTEIHRNNNFQTFGNTILLLFRCATGEAWQEVMMSCVAQPHVKCLFPPEEGEGEDICGSNAAYPYFVSFFVMCSFLVLNLFVAVIMDNFDYLTRDWSILGSHHLPEFMQHWSEYDPDAIGKIRHDDLINLLRKINPPLGFGMLCPRKRACKRLVAMNLPMNADGTVNFNATIFGLVRTGLQIRTEGNIMEADAELRYIILSLWRDTDRNLLDQVVPPPEVLDEVTVGKFYASVLIQEQYRKYHRRKTRNFEIPGEPQVFQLQAGLRVIPEKDPIIKRTTSSVMIDTLGKGVEAFHARKNILSGYANYTEKSQFASKLVQLTSSNTEHIAFSLETGEFLYRPNKRYLQEENVSLVVD